MYDYWVHLVWAGKSTLALSLLRMVEPSGGKIVCVVLQIMI